MQREEPDRCRVCGRELEDGEGIRAVYEGRLLRFCSPEDQARFEEDPGRYGEELQCLSRPPGYW